jgi:uncharacterized repeat protein (TIGR03803 family)
LVRDAAGNLYGTAFQGGIYGKGTVFEITAAGKMRVLHSFTGGTDGAEPTAGLTESNDILYGTTAHGGTGGYGVVFKLPLTGKLAGKLTTLHTFNFVDGAIPFGGVVLDAKGNIYGTTYKGGTQQASCDEGCGVVFKITSAGVESTLYNFTGVQYGDGMYPYGGLVMDSKGNLYGTTVEGGEGTGTIFKVAP